MPRSSQLSYNPMIAWLDYTLLFGITREVIQVAVTAFVNFQLTTVAVLTDGRRRPSGFNSLEC
jgi:hypothetical protein